MRSYKYVHTKNNAKCSMSSQVYMCVTNHFTFDAGTPTMLCYVCVTVAMGIELRIMGVPMLTQNQCKVDLSAHDERLGHGIGQIPCILSLCFFEQTSPHGCCIAITTLVSIVATHWRKPLMIARKQANAEAINLVTLPWTKAFWATSGSTQCSTY